MWIKKLSSALNLVEVSQDWGICNADPNRVEDFILYYESNTIEDHWENEALAELIFQSMNEALEIDDRYIEIFRRFLDQHKDEFPKQIQYWKSLKGNDEFPITNLITKNA